jgi:phosphatidate cytidylyltransferase
MLRTRVITAVVLLGVLLSALFSNSFPVFFAVTSIFFAAAAWESFRLFRGQQAIVGALFWTAAFAFLVFKGDLSRSTPLFGLCVAIWIIRLAPSLGSGLPALESVANRFLNGVYGIAVLGCFLAIVALFKHSAVYLLSVMAIVWIADIGAYFSGKAFGRHKLAPSISPGKSWEGVVGGWMAVLVLAGMTTAVPLLNGTFSARIYDKWGVIGLVAIMTLLVAASVVGDLFESQLKRRAGMKDSSGLLPGHGGVLDRIDALIPVLPMAVLLDAWL